MIAPPRRVLILKPCCLGDVLLATPLAAALAAAWPDARIDWAVGAHSRPALAGNPHLTGLIDASGCIRGELRPTALLQLIRAVRRRRYDAAFVPDRSPILALVPRLAGVPLRVGLDSGGRGRWHSVRVPVPADRHEAEIYLDLARAVGITPPAPWLVFVPSAADREAATRALGGNIAVGQADSAALRIAIHPGGGINPGMALLSKRWPAARYAALMDRLVAEFGADLVLLGGPGDEAVVAEVLARAQAPTRARTLDLGGRLALGEVAAVIEASALYVGNDSGIAHLAAAVGAPVAVVFGPTRPERYGPLPGAGIAVAPDGLLDAAGQPVDRLADAVDSAAIEAVSVDAVWEACAELLGRRGG